MARASMLIENAENRYSNNMLTPGITRQIRDDLENGIAEALGFLANIIMCDYLNRWNNASQKSLIDAQLAVDIAKHFADVAIAHYAQGFIYRAEGRHPRAEIAFTQSLQISDSVRTRAQLAAEMSYNGKFDDALAMIRQVIIDATAQNPDHPALGMFQWIEGRTRFFKEDYPNAITCFDQSVVRWQNSWFNWLYRVSAYAMNGDTKTAEGLLADFNDQFPGYETIAKVIAAEGTNPNENPDVKRGRDAFHTGLEKAGMK